VNDAPGATHALNPLTKQAHDRDRVPDFYTQTSRVTAQPPTFVCDEGKGSASKANSTFHKSRANSFAPQGQMSSPVLSQMKLRSFYEQHG
jgi:hypothetical protein